MQVGANGATRESWYRGDYTVGGGRSWSGFSAPVYVNIPARICREKEITRRRGNRRRRRKGRGKRYKKIFLKLVEFSVRSFPFLFLQLSRTLLIYNNGKFYNRKQPWTRSVYRKRGGIKVAEYTEKYLLWMGEQPRNGIPVYSLLVKIKEASVDRVT